MEQYTGKHAGLKWLYFTDRVVIIQGMEDTKKKETTKVSETVRCLCDNPLCAKCLLINCQDDNCPIHTKVEKEKRRRLGDK